MNGEIVQYKPCFGINEFQMGKTMEGYLRFMKDFKALDRIKFKEEWFNGQLYKVSNKYIRSKGQNNENKLVK